MSRPAAIALVLLSAVGFGSMALFAKLAYAAGVSPTLLLTLRFTLATVLLAPVVGLKRLRLPRGRALAGFALMGGLYTAQAQSYFTALVHASSGLVALLVYVYPVLVTLFAIMLGWEKPDRRTFALVAIATVGIAVTLGGHLEGEPLGIALGLLAGGVYAFYILLGGRLSREADPLAATLVVLATAAFGNGLIAVAEQPSLPRGLVAWGAIGGIALFSTAFAIGAFLAGVRHIGAAQASIVSTFEPVVTLGLGVALLGERLSASQCVGGGMVLTAVVLLALRPKAPLIPETICDG